MEAKSMMLIEKVGDMQTLLYFLKKKNPKLAIL